MTFENGPHHRVHEGLRQAFQQRNLDELRRWLELGTSPRFERQQVVREVLRPAEDTGQPLFLNWAIGEHWATAIPLLVQAGARLDQGPPDAPHEDAPSDGRTSSWYSAVHELLGVASVNAQQARPTPPGRRRKAAAAGPAPMEAPIVVMLRTLCELGAQVNGRNDQGLPPLALVIGGTGWWRTGEGGVREGTADGPDPLDDQPTNVGEALLRTLLDAKADPNLGDLSGNRLLHDLVPQVLAFRPFVWALQAGADPELANEAGATAVSTARAINQVLLLAAMAEVERQVLSEVLVKGVNDRTVPEPAQDPVGRRRL